MKRILSFLIGLSLLATMILTPTVAAETKGAERFKDLKTTDWHYQYIDKLTQLGAIAGMPDGTFAPNSSITRAAFVKIIVATTIGAQQPGNNHWAENYINKAEETGLLFPDEFKADTLNTPILRGEMAKVIARCMEYVLKEDIVPNTDTYTKKIKDWSTICETCKPSIAQAYAKGIIAGMPDGSFSGKNTATRAEATAMIVRMIDKSFRVKLVGDIPFTPLTDVATDGRMKIEKAQQYMDQTLNSLEFYKDNGKYYVKGSFPELPEGFENWLKITVVRKNKPVITLTNGFTMIQENVIPKTGSFNRELVGMASAAEIEQVEIQISVEGVGIKSSGDYDFEGHYSITTTTPNRIGLVYDVSPFTTKYIDFNVMSLFKW